MGSSRQNLMEDCITRQLCSKCLAHSNTPTAVVVRSDSELFESSQIKAHDFLRWVVFIGGEAVISLPNSTQIASVPGGRRGLVFAVDTANVSTLGHITNYPSDQETVALQIPTLNSQIPAHTVLHDGPCKLEEQNQ